MRCLLASLAIVVAIVLGSSPARADGDTIRNKQVGTVQPNGDIALEHTLTLPLLRYNALKAETSGNTALLLRRLGTATQSSVFADASARFDDKASAVVVRATLLGGMKVRGRRWYTELADAEHQEVVDQTERTIILLSIKPGDDGTERTTTKLVFPEGTKDIEWDASSGRVSCEMPTPAFDASGDPDVRVKLDVKPEIMSCFYKLYGKPQFTKLWVARAVVENKGAGLARDFRIRYRIAGYSPWSPWHTSSKVYPTQHVVAAYYPLFDHARVKTLTSEAPSVLEVEWSHDGADGERVTERDRRPITLLGMNQVLWSSMPLDEATTWSEVFDNAALVAATFVSNEDPIVQQLVGYAERVGEGVGAHISDQHTMHFVNALYNLMLANEIMYQSPPSLFKRNARQHVKYARDVVRNRAGTCVDLAILFASVCEAAGVPAYVVYIPGHAFPAFRLPSGRVVPFEATYVSPDPERAALPFGKALERGDQTMRKYMEAGAIMVVDIHEMRTSGVPTPELPDLPPDALRAWGFRDAGPGDHTGPPADRPDSQPAGTRTLTSEQGAFVITFPAAWTVQEQPDRVLAVFDEGRGAISVISDRREHDSVGAFRDAALQRISGNQKDLDVTAADEPAQGVARVEATFIDEDDVPMRARYVFLVTESRQILLAYLAHGNRYETLWPQAQVVLDSFDLRTGPAETIPMVVYEDAASLFALYVPKGWQVTGEPTGATAAAPDETFGLSLQIREREGEDPAAFASVVKATLRETFTRWRETGEARTTLAGLDALQVDGTTIEQGQSVRVRMLFASSEQIHWMLMLMARQNQDAGPVFEEVTKRLVLREPSAVALEAVKNNSGELTQGVPSGWTVRRTGDDIVADAPQRDASVVCRVADRTFEDVDALAEHVLAAHARRSERSEVLAREVDSDDPGILHVVVSDQRAGHTWWRIFSFRLTESRQMTRVLIARADLAFKWNPTFERCVKSWQVR